MRRAVPKPLLCPCLFAFVYLTNHATQSVNILLSAFSKSTPRVRSNRGCKDETCLLNVPQVEASQDLHRDEWLAPSSLCVSLDRPPGANHHRHWPLPRRRKHQPPWHATMAYLVRWQDDGV